MRPLLYSPESHRRSLEDVQISEAEEEIDRQQALIRTIVTDFEDLANELDKKTSEIEVLKPKLANAINETADAMAAWHDERELCELRLGQAKAKIETLENECDLLKTKVALLENICESFQKLSEIENRRAIKRVKLIVKE